MSRKVKKGAMAGSTTESANSIESIRCINGAMVIFDEAAVINKAYSKTVIGTTGGEISLSSDTIDTGGFIDISMMNPDTLSLLIAVSNWNTTGSLTLSAAFSEDAAGLFSTDMIELEAGITIATPNPFIKLGGYSEWSYSHFVKIQLEETAGAAVVFKSVLMGRENK